MVRVLHVSPTFWPATHWGGPIFSTRAICDGMVGRDDVALRVLTTDNAGRGKRVSAMATATDPYPVIRTRRMAGVSVAPGLLLRMPGEIMRSDLVHLTGVYNFTTLPTLALARLLGRPVVWSPRGALQATSDWENVPRRRTKVLFERLCQIVRPSKTVLHVTSAQEQMRSVSNLRDIDISLIPNAVTVPERLPQRIWRPEGRLRLLYLGRLHPKKGLELLFGAMDRLPEWVTLTIYGDGASEYVDRLRALASGSGRISFRGFAGAAEKHEAFAEADAFVLPSWSENFGIVVAEALANGVPVLTTNRTPWLEIEDRGCGAVFDPAADDLSAAIIGLSERNLEAMGHNGHNWMRDEFAVGDMCDQFAVLYRRLVR